MINYPENSTEITEVEWAQWIAYEWAAELSDPREDVYALMDGGPGTGLITVSDVTV